jgi:hypothetical protein
MMHYDLHNLIQHVNLPILDDPFSAEEIQAALQAMPSDHAQA